MVDDQMPYSPEPSGNTIDTSNGSMQDMNIESRLHTSMDQEPCNDVRSDNFICGVVEGFYGKPWTFEQRKDLFSRIKTMRLNAFLYAPKDDVKHRSRWRQLYSEQEAVQLKSLIDEAHANNIDFYYSLAPGLDMTYSDENDLDLLIRKFDQLVSLGCKSFAILFDDIEPRLDEKDKEMFKDYACAQVSVTNLIYKHLRCPKFLFCPTEYCETRAVPSLLESNYLKTIGSGLMQGIDILWSGSQVISKYITVESIEALTRIIERKPVIWENLHANDYDRKRIFLGPYSGRSTKIIPLLRGVLTNPNCEYEANYIAIHTLAQWSYCTEDINEHNRSDPKKEFYDSLNNNLASRAEKQDTDRNIQHWIEQQNPGVTANNQQHSEASAVYSPDTALQYAIRDWLTLVMEARELPRGADLSNQVREREITSAEASEQLTKDHQQQQLVQQLREAEQQTCNAADAAAAAAAAVETVVVEADMAVADETTQLSTDSSCKSLMDTSGGPTSSACLANSNNNNNTSSCSANNIQIDVSTCDSNIMQEDAETCDSLVVNKSQSPEPILLAGDIMGPSSSSSSGASCLGSILNGNNAPNAMDNDALADKTITTSTFVPFTTDDMTLLVDLFYLPFEHGSVGCTMLNDVRWLRDHSDSMVWANRCPNEGEERGPTKTTPELWLSRAEKLAQLCASIEQLVDKFVRNCPNKLILLELYPYLADMRDATLLCMDFVKFLRGRNSLEARFCNDEQLIAKLKQPKQVVEDQEPWVHQGGLIGDLQRLFAAS